MKKIIIIAPLIVFILLPHSGRTDSSGGHNNRKTGGYHYHSGGTRSTINSTPRVSVNKIGRTVNSTPESSINKSMLSKLKSTYAAQNSANVDVTKRYREKRNYRKIKIDIETDKEVIATALDNSHNLMAIQRALFFSVLTKKQPVVLIFDTDGKEGNYEYQVRKACELAKITYRNIKVN